ncbi:hypothetical protein HK098_002657 [Nowakowskiella sp. JEL0407]|nr:hypothetical protein HK098_002657 [Nowakowskiella sp. JEL0407]
MTSPIDPNSFASTEDTIVKSTHLNLSVEFSSKKLFGSVNLIVETLKDTGLLILDTAFLKISSVYLSDNKTPLEFKLRDRNELFGSALEIYFPTKPKGSVFGITIEYETTEGGTAVQWLEKSQTLGKKHPYLFTQCQAIHARSMLPCQDTPCIKSKYTAEIKVPAELTALMSAIKDGEDHVVGSYKICKFKQPIAIPSYLMALAVGNIHGHSVGPRSTVYCEPEQLDACVYEFEGTEKFIATGESLLTPYCWGRYDLLILPASFPFGGMENPCLTFVTPSLLAGDRSLVDVVAHEISHSWMGNLVTSANWEHFWLNEGFTMFIERKIVERLHGRQEQHLSAIVGLRALKESVEHFEEIKRVELTRLVPQLEGVDPDDAFSSIPYEKGCNFLFYLEEILGGPSVFEPWLVAYVTSFSHNSITTEIFKNHLYKYIEEHHKEKIDILNKVDWDAWFNGTGMPPVIVEYDRTLVNDATALASRWESARDDPRKGNFSKNDIASFSPTQKFVFLEALLAKPPFSHSFLQYFDEVYGFSNVKNSEIKFRFLWLCLNAEYEAVFSIVAEFLGQIGRMKYIRPLYRALSKCANGKKLARETFLKYRDFYHPIAVQMVAKDLGVDLK